MPKHNSIFRELDVPAAYIFSCFSAGDVRRSELNRLFDKKQLFCVLANHELYSRDDDGLPGLYKWLDVQCKASMIQKYHDYPLTIEV